MIVKIKPNDRGTPTGKLADAEMQFTDGPLEGLRLVGFAVWEHHRGGGRHVTFPARTYSVHGDKRSYVLLQPISDRTAENRARDLVLDAYAAFEADTSDGGWDEG